MNKPNPGHGRCPECGQWISLKGYGALRTHHRRTDAGYGRCPGREPAEPVPCTGCGQTGVELTVMKGLCSACRAARRKESTEGEPA